MFPAHIAYVPSSSIRGQGCGLVNSPCRRVLACSALKTYWSRSQDGAEQGAQLRFPHKLGRRLRQEVLSSPQRVVQTIAPVLLLAPSSGSGGGQNSCGFPQNKSAPFILIESITSKFSTPFNADSFATREEKILPSLLSLQRPEASTDTLLHSCERTTDQNGNW